MLTPDNYPFEVYPGFTHPEDWRLCSVEQLSEREERKIAQLTDDVADDHDVKHVRREHPWCYKCDARRLSIDGPLLRDAGSTVEISTLALEGAARDTTASRCRRYLTLHSVPPVDLYRPEDDQRTSLADELLHRDKLTDLASADPLIEGILTRNAYAILSGRDATYKSFTALDWGLCLATGKPWQGRPVQRVKVLYIVGEGAYDLDNRINAWETGWRTMVDPAWFVTLPRATNLHSGDELDELLDVVADFGLVIIDTLRRVSGRADGNGSEMGIVIDNVEKIKRATNEGSVLVLTHTDKGDNDSRGFSGIEDDADIVWKTKKIENTITLTNEKMRSGPDGEKIALAPTLTAGSVILHTTAEILSGEVETSAAQKTVLNALATVFAHTDGATTSELIEATGLPKSTFYHARGALLAADLIESNGPSGRARYSLTRSNGVQSTTTPLTCTIPTSPTGSNGSGPVQSSPTPLKGLDVGPRTLDNPKKVTA